MPGYQITSKDGLRVLSFIMLTQDYHLYRDDERLAIFV